MRARSSGSLLIVALWVIVVLAAGAVALGGYLSTETRLMRYHIAQAQAKAWARAGVYLAMQRLALDATTPEQTNPDLFYDWLGDDWAVTPSAEDPAKWVVPMPAETPSSLMLTGDVTIQIIDEERKLDLNAAVEPILTTFLGNPAAALAIIDYRDADSVGSYEGDPNAQPPYLPKNAPVTMLEELWEIPVLRANAAAVRLVDQEGSVALGGTVNVNTVSDVVLKALVNDPALDGVINQLITGRPGADGQLGTPVGAPDDCVVTQLGAAPGIKVITPDICDADMNPVELAALLSKAGLALTSSVFRITAIGRVQKPAVQYQIDAIASRAASGGGPGGSAPTLPFAEQTFQILAWHER